MTERKGLTPGTIITLRQDGYTRQYRIINVIGEGTTCIVYEAERMGSVRSPRCRIKECYPRHTQTERIGDTISWRVPNERETTYQRMQKAHDLMVSLRNDETIGNHIPTTELFEGNGTLYSVMEINHAGIDTIRQIDNVYDLLEIMRVLTEIVSCIHEKGYLHLDLKPANFLARVDPTVSVWMFDVDSFEEISSIREKCVHGISYSKGYAPPEQQSANLDQISEKADIYAIGAIMFESIMGRLPGSMDRGSYPEWQFEGPLFERINPIVKVRLREIFKKTLALNPRKRYDTARELADMLAEVRDLVQEPFLVSNVPSSLQTFIGREEELQVLESALQKRIVVIQGVGGIGKSELAKRYAHLHSHEYQAVIYSHYKGCVEETMSGITIQNFYGYAEKHEILQRLLNKNTLWVIDGFDTNECGDIHLLEELECDIIITSRQTWDEYFLGASIALHALSFSEQLLLFETELGRSLSDYEVEDVKEILNYIEGYTLLIPLLAKQLRKGYYSIRDMLRELRKGGIQGASAGMVKHFKDGMALSGPVYHILCGLFDVTQFSEQEKGILATLVLCKNYLVRQDNLINWLGRECLMALDEVISSGWIQREDRECVTYISMHSVLLEVASANLRPNIELCPGLKKHLEAMATKVYSKYKTPIVEIHSDGEGLAADGIEPEDVIEYEATVNLLADIIEGYTWCDLQDAEFWMDISRKLVCVLFGDDKCLSRITQSIERLMRDDADMSLQCKWNALLTLATIAIKQKKPNVAARHIQELRSLVNEHQNRESVLFQACFAVYQFLCTGYAGCNYDKLFGMHQLVADINTVFEVLVEHWDESGLSALVEGRRTALSKIIVQQIYKDFCRLAFGETACEDDAIEDECDGCFLADDWYKNEENSVTEVIAGETSELQSYIDTVRSAVASVLSILVAAGEFVFFDWIPRSLTEEEHQQVASILRNVDIRLEYQPEFLLESDNCVANLVNTEVQFTQAYVRIEDGEAYDFHSNNLIQYYIAMVQRNCCGDENKEEMQMLPTMLPSYRSLLFDRRLRLPAAQALDFLYSLTVQMEDALQNHPRKNGMLREIYRDGMEIAEEAKAVEKERFFRDRYQIAGMAALRSKDLDKRMQQLKRQLEDLKQ